MAKSGGGGGGGGGSRSGGGSGTLPKKASVGIRAQRALNTISKAQQKLSQNQIDLRKQIVVARNAGNQEQRQELTQKLSKLNYREGRLQKRYLSIKRKYDL